MRVIYLHGFASGPASGKAQWFRRCFAERGVELEIPDLVVGDFEDITVTGQLDVIRTLMRGDEVSLIGSSMGGYLAALCASQYNNVRKLVLMAPAFHFPRRWPEELGPERSEEWRRTGRLEVFHYGQGRSTNVGWTLIEDALKYEAEPSFRQPALIFHGTNDTVVPPAYSEAFAARHANVRLRLLPSDHQLTDMTQVMWNEMAPFLLGG
jgi:hypothetical protein